MSNSVVPDKKPGIRHQSSFGFKNTPITKKTEPTKAKASKPVGKVSRPSQIKENKTEDKTSEQEIKEAEAKFDKLLTGCLDDLPSLPRSTVRIFVSSTFSDMRAERNAIVRDVVPILKEDCARFDLDLQLVDMRWGVTEDSQSDHSVEKICLLEVENCQKISLGPNFILISGDRYGFRPIPTEIASKEFEIIKRFAAEASVPDVKLLDDWYLLDENANPPLYVLQPIRSKYTFYGDYTPGCEEVRAKDTLAWDQTFKSLQNILHESATLAFKAKQLTEDKLQNYYISVTESEVNKGILTAEEPQIHTSVYQRKLKGFVNENFSDKTAKRYFDTSLTNGKLSIDEDAKLRREKLTKEKVQSAMTKSGRVHIYQPQWYEGGIDPDKHKDHQSYVRQLCYDLIQDITDLIDKARKKQKDLIRISEYYSYYQEVLHHYHFCNLKCETFCGREDVLLKAKEYILNDKSRKPLVLYAPSGAGKTSIMAKIMQSLPKWFKKQPHIGVIKFLGTSPQTINIYDVLYAVCGQLADSAQLLMEPVGYKTMKNMLDYMPRFFRRASNKLKKPTVILLDSIDQLSPNNDAYLCNWLPTVLPANVRLIVSTLPEEHGILDSLKSIFPDMSNFVEVPALPDEAGFEMIDTYLMKKKRKVSQMQRKQIINAFRKCRGALYLKLVLDEAVKWNSYTPENAIFLQDSVQGAINQLFDNMEKKFGKVLISHALGYITVAFNGISDIEWEDVLSCDDEVLDDIYRYHNPPVPGIVRMPPVLVARIRYDLQEYIVERRSFGKTTLNWYHRQFIETAHTRYTIGEAGKKLYKVLSEYFIANEGIQRDITLQRRNITIQKADRQVTKQPLTVKNIRKLTAIPYYITHAGDQIDSSKAKTDCFCNLDFLKVRIASLPLSSLVEDMTQYLEKTEDEEVAYLKNYFLVNKTVSGGTNLAISFLSNLLVDDSKKHLKELEHQAKDMVYASKSPLLIPLFPCLAPRTDVSSAPLQIYNGIDDIVTEGLEAVRMTNVTVDDIDNTGYSVYDAVSSEMYCIDTSKENQSNITPLLDMDKKQVIQFDKDRLVVTHFANEAIKERKYTDICKEIKVPDTHPVKSILSSDCLHITILFSNRKVLTFDTNSHKKVDLFTLSENPSDDVNIFTTSADNLRVIIATSFDVGQMDTEAEGCVMVHVVGDAENGKMLKTGPFYKNLVAIGNNESLLVGCSNKEGKGGITVVDLDTIKILLQKECSEVKQLSVSPSQAISALWLKQGSVAMYNLTTGDTVQEINIGNSITSVGVSWILDLVFIGDTQGKIIIYKGQMGKHLIDVNGDDIEIVKMSVLENQIVTLNKLNTVKVWQISSLLNNDATNLTAIQSGLDSNLLSQREVLSFDTDTKGENILIASMDKTLRIWSVGNVELRKEINLGSIGNKVIAASGSVCIVLDSLSKTLKVIDFKECDEKMANKNVVDFCLGKDRNMLYLVKTNERGHHVEIIDLRYLKSQKSFLLNQSLEYQSLDISLNESERYLILRVQITEKDYADIQTSIKSSRTSGPLPKSHWHRFYAVDLTQATGGLMTCNRILTKQPHLGEIIRPYKGNVMMITSRRWVLFWDIPTGKCDQRVTKGGTMEKCALLTWKGASLSVERSSNGLYIAVGSDSGYMIVWDVKTGLPVGGKEPKTRHTAPVVKVAISPDSNWVVSNCKNNMLKLWEISTCTEVFSLKIPSDIQQMRFTADSKHLIINTGVYNTRMLVYRLHTGQ